MKRALLISLCVYLSYFTLQAQKRGQEKIDSLLSEVERTTSDTSKIRLFVMISYNYEYTDATTALKWSLKALELSKRIKWKPGQFAAINQTGFVYGALGNYTKAMENSSEALRIATELEDESLLMKAYLSMGLISDWKAEYTRALEYLYKSLRLAEKLNNKSFAATVYANISNVYQEMGQHSRSIVILEKTIKAFEDLKSPENIAITYLNMGIAYHECKNPRKALDCYFRSLKIIEEYDKPYVTSKLMSSIASAYNEFGDYDKAIEYNNRSIKLCEDIKDPRGIAFGYANIGSIYLDMAIDTVKRSNEKQRFINKGELLQSSVLHLKKAASIANQLNVRDLEVQVWSEMSKAYKEMGDFKLAFEAFQKAKIIADSNFSIEKQKLLADMEAKYENEVKQKEIEVLTEKNMRQRVLITSAVVIVLLLAGLVAIVIVSLRNKRRANVILEQKNAIIQSDLEEAKDYVLSLLPARLNNGTIVTDWKFVPSSQLGGDAFGYNWLDDNHFFFYILDVCGHGIGSALHAVSVVNAINSQTNELMDLKNPGKAISFLNENFLFTNHNGLFFSMWYGVYNKLEAKLTYVCAGHPPPVMFDGEGNQKLLGNTNIAVGWVEGYQFKTVTIDVEKNSRIVLFTDGVYEFENVTGEINLIDKIYDVLTKDNNLSMDGYHDILVSQCKSQTFPDDYSMVMIGIS
ncbi:MAG: SpoIIE family protein phosphatase [Bacteroidales bacterium]